MAGGPVFHQSLTPSSPPTLTRLSNAALFDACNIQDTITREMGQPIALREASEPLN